MAKDSRRLRRFLQFGAPLSRVSLKASLRIFLWFYCSTKAGDKCPAPQVYKYYHTVVPSTYVYIYICLYIYMYMYVYMFLCVFLYTFLYITFAYK